MRLRTVTGLAVLLGTALVLRVAYVLWADGGRFRGEAADSDDGRQYVALAQSLAAGEGFALDGRPTSWRAPLYPVALAPLFRFSDRPLFAARMVQCLLGALTVALVWRIGSDCQSRAAGWLAAGACAVSYELVNLNAYVLSETLFTLLHTAAFAALARYACGGRRVAWAAAAGGLLGLAILARAQPLLLPLAMAPWFLCGRADGALRRARAGHAAAFALAAYAVVAPWTIRNARVHGAFVPVSTDFGKQLYQANSPGATGGTGGWIARGVDWQDPPGPAGEAEVAAARRLARAAGRHIVAHPGATLCAVPRRLWNLVRPWVAGASCASTAAAAVPYVAMVALAAVGLWRGRAEDRLRAALPWIPVVYTLALHTLLAATVRYRYPLLPLLAVPAAVGLLALCRPRRPRSATGAA